MEQKDLECLLCQDENIKFLVEKSDFSIFKCKGCGLIFCHPMPTEEYLDKFYQNFALTTYFQQYAEEKALMSKRAMEVKIRIAQELAGKRFERFLDVGCGFGYDLEAAIEMGMECTGIEKDYAAVRFAKELFDLDIENKELFECSFPENHFDIVHVNQLIEHIPDPITFLREIYRIMKPRGILIMGTPNTNSLEYIPTRRFLDDVIFLKTFEPKMSTGMIWYKSLRREWGYVDPPRHLVGFSKSNIPILMTKANFETKKVVISMRGDPVYEPLTDGEIRDMINNEEQAIQRLKKKSFLLFLLFKGLYSPFIALFKRGISLFNNGIVLTVYGQKVARPGAYTA